MTGHEQIHYQEVTHKYRLAEMYTTHIPVYPPEDIVTDFIVLTTTGKLTLSTGYASDGPSGPAYDTKGSIRGAFVHDGGYQLIRLGKLDPKWRAVLDQHYENCLRTDAAIVVRRDLPERLKFMAGTIIKLARIRAEGHRKMLRLFGSKAAEVGSEPPILTAP